MTWIIAIIYLHYLNNYDLWQIHVLQHLMESSSVFIYMELELGNP